MSAGVEQLAPYLRRLLASNPGPMTLEGTNTWVLGDPDVAPPVVVDPGPDDEPHLRSVLAACRGAIACVLLTHRHLDHAEGAARLGALAGCGVRAVDPGLVVGSTALVDREELAVAGARLRGYATPGHTSDSYSWLVEADDAGARLVTGDTVLGRGTSVIAAPDGNLRSYLDSLVQLEQLVRDHRVREILPGHGPRVEHPEAWLAGYRRHRVERLRQVSEALAAGDRTAHQIVVRVYADVDPQLWPAAELSVMAQLDYLEGA